MSILIYLATSIILLLPLGAAAVPITGQFSGVITQGVDVDGIIVSPNASLEGLSISGIFSYESDNVPANSFPNEDQGWYFNPRGGLISFTLKVNGKFLDFSNYEQNGIQIFDEFSGFDLYGLYIGAPGNFTEFRIYDYENDILQSISPLVSFKWDKNIAANLGGYSEASFHLSNVFEGYLTPSAYAIYDINSFSIGPTPVTEPSTLWLLSGAVMMLFFQSRKKHYIIE